MKTNYYIRKYGKSYALYNKHTRCRVSAWDNWRETMEFLQASLDKTDRLTGRVGGLDERSNTRYLGGYQGPL